MKLSDVIVIILVIMIAVVFTCVVSLFTFDIINKDTTSRSNIMNSIVDHGNGVLFFNSDQKNIGNDISIYVNNHPDIKIISVSSPGGPFGGFYIVVENRSVCNV